MPTPYLSEIKYRGSAAQDFVEVVLDGGADPSGISVVIYHPNGGIRSINSLDSVVDTVAGKDVYVVSNGVHKNGAVALVEDGVVISFVSFDNVVTASAGPADGTSSTQIGSTGNDQTASLTSTDGSSFSVEDNPNSGTIPCFLRGTRISIPSGEVPVEQLAVGDRVVLLDGSAEPLKWIGRATADATGANADSGAPVCIPRGALGRNRPKRDLFVSPQHRVSMGSPAFELWFADRDVLIPAKHLVGWNGIYQDSTIAQPEYFHLLFAAHQVIWSEGIPTESFHPSTLVVDQFSRETRRELFRIFPELGEDGEMDGATAQKCLRSFEATVALKLALAG